MAMWGRISASKEAWSPARAARWSSSSATAVATPCTKPSGLHSGPRTYNWRTCARCCGNGYELLSSVAGRLVVLVDLRLQRGDRVVHRLLGRGLAGDGRLHPALGSLARRRHHAQQAALGGLVELGLV